MQRKLVKQGNNALTLTLPATWVHKKGLVAGDTVDVQEQNTNLVVRIGLRAQKKKATINVKGESFNSLWHILNGKYIEGYDEMTLIHDSPVDIERIAREMIGVVIEEHSDTRTIIRNIAAVPEENFDALLRRSGHLLVQEAKVLEEVAAGKATLKELKSIENLLNSTVSYCMRYLNKYATSEHAYNQFLLVTTIEEAGDILKTIGRHIGRRKKLAKDIRQIVETYDALMFKREYNQLFTKLRSFRDNLRTDSFIDGLAFWLAEVLYDNLGYLIQNG